MLIESRGTIEDINELRDDISIGNFIRCLSVENLIQICNKNQSVTPRVLFELWRKEKIESMKDLLNGIKRMPEIGE